MDAGKITILTNYAAVGPISDIPKSKRRKFVDALDQVRKSGTQNVFEGMTYSPIESSRRMDPVSIFIDGPKETGIRKPQASWEISYSEGGRQRRLRFYFSIDFNTREDSEPYLDVANTADGRQVLAVVKHVPLLVYVCPIPGNGRYQRAGYRTEDLENIGKLFEKPRFVAVQKEHGIEMVADVIGKDLFLEMGSGLTSIQGELFDTGEIAESAMRRQEL